MKSTNNDCTSIAVGRGRLLMRNARSTKRKRRALRHISQRQTVRRVSRTRKDANEREPGSTMRAQHLATGLTPILKQNRTTKPPLKLPTLPIPPSRTLFYNVKVDLKNALLHAEWALMAAERNAAQ